MGIKLALELPHATDHAAFAMHAMLPVKSCDIEACSICAESQPPSQRTFTISMMGLPICGDQGSEEGRGGEGLEAAAEMKAGHGSGWVGRFKGSARQADAACKHSHDALSMLLFPAPAFPYLCHELGCLQCKVGEWFVFL